MPIADSQLARTSADIGSDIGVGAEPVGDARIAMLSQLFREHNRMLVAYMTGRLHSVQEAREVAQEAYVRLLQLSQPMAPALLRAYLFKTATNLGIDRLRHRVVRHTYREEQLRDKGGNRADEDPAVLLEAREQSLQLLGFLQELPRKCREAFDLHRFQGLTQPEVGARLGLSDRMVRRYVTYAMVYCRLRMDGWNADQARHEVSP
jgi:RNA polymerase sigma factor (sigma-70 family)